MAKTQRKIKKKSIFMNLFYDYFNSDSYKKLIQKYKFASAFKMQNNGNELNTVNLQKSFFFKEINHSS